MAEGGEDEVRDPLARQAIIDLCGEVRFSNDMIKLLAASVHTLAERVEKLESNVYPTPAPGTETKQ